MSIRNSWDTRSTRGFKTGWAYHKYAEFFGGKHPNGLRQVAATPTPEILGWIKSRQIAAAKASQKRGCRHAVSVRDVALGKWPGLLLGFGLTERQLSGKHGPCPVCGGRDRFRFDDQEGRGTWICSHCGAGDGVALVMALKGWDFRTAAREIEQAAGVVQAGEIPKRQGEAEKIERLRRVWSESMPLQAGDEAMRYLAGRGLTLATIPDCLRLHPELPYYDGEPVAGQVSGAGCACARFARSVASRYTGHSCKMVRRLPFLRRRS